MFRKPTNNNTSTVINPGNTDHKNPSVISGNNSITISGVTYNNDKKVAFINGKVSDPAAEGSMIMTATNANTGKKITTAVVGGKGVFAIELPMTNEVQNVKITSDDDSYAAVTTKVEAIKADKPVVNTDQNNKQNNSVKDEVNITSNTEKQANSTKKNTQVVSKNTNSEKATVTNPVYKSAIKTNDQGKNVITTSHNSAAHAVAQKSNNNAKVLPKTGTKENIVALFGLAITSTTALFGLALRKKN